MAADPKSAHYEGNERRRWSRHNAGGDAAILMVDETQIDCRIDNISLAGARLSIDGNIREGALVRLEAGTRSAPLGHCVWRGPNSLGLKFRLSQDSVDLTLACIRRQAGLENLPEERPA